MQIIKGAVSLEEIKRCYVGVCIKINCPICGYGMEINLDEHYLQYPIIPSTEVISFYCEKCDEKGKDHYFELPVSLKSCDLVMEYDPLDIRKEE